MITVFCVLACVAVLAAPVNLLRKAWSASTAKWLFDAAVNPGPAPVPTTPPSVS